MQTPLPPAPPAPQHRSRAWIWATVVSVLVVLAIIGSAVEQNQESARGTVSTEIDQPVAPVEAPSYEVTASDVVDVMGTAEVQRFCGYYYQLGDYDMALEYFKQGFGSSQDPSAEEVFDELLSRC